VIGYAVVARWVAATARGPRRKRELAETAKPAVFHFPLEQVNEAFAQQDKGYVTRAAIVPN